MHDYEWKIPEFKHFEISEKKTRYCLCIPIINEGEKFKKQLLGIAKFSRLVDIIICDGGSTDGSTDLEFLKANHVRTLLVKTGNGKLSAQLRMGYAYALNGGYEGVITIDGNGKDVTDSIPSFVSELEKGFDFIQGSRFISGGHAINTPVHRLFAIKLIHAPFISLLAGFHYTDTTNGYRAYSKKLLEDKRVAPFRDIFETYELLAYLSVRAPRLGFKTEEIPVTRKYPRNEKIPTKISLIKGNFGLIKILVGLLFGKYNPATRNDDCQ